MTNSILQTYLSHHYLYLGVPRLVDEDGGEDGWGEDHQPGPPVHADILAKPLLKT